MVGKWYLHNTYLVCFYLEDGRLIASVPNGDLQRG